PSCTSSSIFSLVNPRDRVSRSWRDRDLGSLGCCSTSLRGDCVRCAVIEFQCENCGYVKTMQTYCATPKHKNTSKRRASVASRHHRHVDLACAAVDSILNCWRGLGLSANVV